MKWPRGHPIFKPTSLRLSSTSLYNVVCIFSDKTRIVMGCKWYLWLERLRVPIIQQLSGYKPWRKRSSFPANDFGRCIWWIIEDPTDRCMFSSHSFGALPKPCWVNHPRFKVFALAQLICIYIYYIYIFLYLYLLYTHPCVCLKSWKTRWFNWYLHPQPSESALDGAFPEFHVHALTEISSSWKAASDMIFSADWETLHRFFNHGFWPWFFIGYIQ